MTSEFPGGPRPEDQGRDAGPGIGAGYSQAADLGPAPGLAQLIATLHSGPVGNELAGEHAALAMFRANFRPPAPGWAAAGAGAAGGAGALGAAGIADAAGAGASGGAGALGSAGATGGPGHAAGGPGDAAAPAGIRPVWRQRRLWSRGFGRIRLVGVAVAVMIAAFAAAAYAAVLPTPVQQLAHDAFHFAGVPKPQHSHATGGHSVSPPPSSAPPSGRAHPTPSASAPSSASPSPHPSPKPSSPTPAGPVVVSAQPAAGLIQAGTPATIEVQVTAGGKADAGLAITLVEHAAGTPGRQVAGRETTNGRGRATFTTPILDTNARFWVADRKGDVSAVVMVEVRPNVVASLAYGPRGVEDYLSVTAQYAQPGDWVALQVMRDGSWVTLKRRRLNGSDATIFTFSATRQEGKTIQVLLLPTRFHAGAVSNSVTVQPPA